MNTMRNTSGGFIQAIILLIIILVIASLYGYNPQVIWSEYIAPIFIFIWGIIVAIVNFVVALIKGGIGAVSFLTNLLTSIGK